MAKKKIEVAQEFSTLLRLNPKDISDRIASFPAKMAVKILRALMASDIKKTITICIQIKPKKLISISNRLTGDEKKKLCDSATEDEDRQALEKLFYRFQLAGPTNQFTY